MNIINLKKRTDKAEQSIQKELTVEGLNARLIAVGADPETEWNFLRSKKEITTDDIYKRTSEFFGMPVQDVVTAIAANT